MSDTFPEDSAPNKGPSVSICNDAFCENNQNFGASFAACESARLSPKTPNDHQRAATRGGGAQKLIIDS